jgi:hypothetical protein
MDSDKRQQQQQRQKQQSSSYHHNQSNNQQIGWIKKYSKGSNDRIHQHDNHIETAFDMRKETLTVLDNHLFLMNLILFTQRYFEIPIPIWIGYQRLLENQKTFSRAFVDTLRQIPSDEIIRFGRKLNDHVTMEMKASSFSRLFAGSHLDSKESFLQNLELTFR